jgi:AcrR family transcriptional regulator
MGRPPQINSSAVVAASLAVSDERGLAGVTIRAVADRLGVTPMALYRHVRDKADLLDRVVEALLIELPLPPADLPWEDRLRTLGQATRTIARRHPSVFPLLLQRPATTPSSRRVRDAIVASLEAAGLDPDGARRAERLISTAILGFAASEAGGRFGGHSRKVIDEDFACLCEVIGLALTQGVAGLRGAAS